MKSFAAIENRARASLTNDEVVIGHGLQPLQNLKRIVHTRPMMTSFMAENILRLQHVRPRNRNDALRRDERVAESGDSLLRASQKVREDMPVGVYDWSRN